VGVWDDQGTITHPYRGQIGMRGDLQMESTLWRAKLPWIGLWMNQRLTPIPDAHRPYIHLSSSRILFLLG
jgi:hypothetical protein